MILRTQNLLTFYVQEHRRAGDLVVVGWDPVAHPAAVVTPGGLLDSLQDENVRIVDARKEVPRAAVIVPVQFQDFSLEKKLHFLILHFRPFQR